MMRSSKLRTKVALAGGVLALAAGSLFAAGAANAATPAPSSHHAGHAWGGLQVANPGQAAPTSATALPQGASVVKGSQVGSNAPGSAQVTSATAGSAAAAATVGTPDASGSLQVANPGQAASASAAALPSGASVVKGTQVGSNTPGSSQVTTASPGSAVASAPAQTWHGHAGSGH